MCNYRFDTLLQCGMIFQNHIIKIISVVFTAEVVRAEVYKAGGRRVGVGYTGLGER